ncbi:hypothetical protein DFH09DRAFT_1360222 [Mycena vulgaris]|nr:hypothetical protein DFH09DRAFT_1360222 [Mycena vulgaris]
MPDNLPQELLDIIVDELSSDIPALKACSLAARAFSPSTRIHIFSTIRLLPPLESNSLTRAKTHCHKFKRLLALSPHLAPLVKDLQIVEGISSDYLRREEESTGYHSGIPWLVAAGRTLTLLLSRLNLARISILCKDKINWDRLPRRLITALHEVFRSPALRSIQIFGIGTAHPQHILDMLTDAHKLKELCLEYWHLQRIQTLDIPRTWRPRLQHLAFRDQLTNGRLSVALSSSMIDFSSLTTLSLSGLYRQPVQSFLKALPLGNIVENLNIWYPLFETHAHPDVGLVFITRLHTVRVSGLLSPVACADVVTECAAHTSVKEIVLESTAVHLGIPEQWGSLSAAVRELDPTKRVEVILGGARTRLQEASLERINSDIEPLVAQGRISLKDRPRLSTLSTYTNPYLAL